MDYTKAMLLTRNNCTASGCFVVLLMVVETQWTGENKRSISFVFDKKRVNGVRYTVQVGGRGPFGPGGSFDKMRKE